MQAQLTAFNALPNVVARILQGIITTLSGALTSGGVVAANVPGLTAAQADLTNITAAYPTVQSQLGIVGVTLYPALAAGTFGLSTITALSSQGADVVSMFNGMQQLFAYQEDAIAQLQGVAANPALPVAVQQQVTAALANLATLQAAPGGGIGTVLVYGVGAFVAYKLLRMIF